jgi:glycyl-tRNA synthetase
MYVSIFYICMDFYMQEAQQLLEKRLPIPAYEHVLKLSHTFNILDSRGAVSVSERQVNFGRMRALSRGVSELFLERRTELGHPLGIVPAFEVLFLFSISRETPSTETA